jgi:hypothetical protein
VAEIGGSDSATQVAESMEKEKTSRHQTREVQLAQVGTDVIHRDSASSSSGDAVKQTKVIANRVRTAAVYSLNRPYRPYKCSSECYSEC